MSLRGLVQMEGQDAIAARRYSCALSPKALHVGAVDGGCHPFLPPLPAAVANDLWAVVFVIEGAAKGTARSGQEYASPLLVLSGNAYAAMPFGVLHARLCDALRGDRPRLAAEVVLPGGSIRLVFDDGSVVDVAGG